MTETLRIDKWLWQARFFKSRTLAGKFVDTGALRLNGNRIAKAHHVVRVNDVLTFPLGPYIRIIKILLLGTRRGPATEARTLYEDLDPPELKPRATVERRLPVAEREKGSGRPTKRDRRKIDDFNDEANS